MPFLLKIGKHCMIPSNQDVPDIPPYIIRETLRNTIKKTIVQRLY